MAKVKWYKGSYRNGMVTPLSSERTKNSKLRKSYQLQGGPIAARKRLGNSAPVWFTHGMNPKSGSSPQTYVKVKRRTP
jgi:hypothetical protein